MFLVLCYELFQGELLLAAAATEGSVGILFETELALPPGHAVMLQQC